MMREGSARRTAAVYIARHLAGGLLLPVTDKHSYDGYKLVIALAREDGPETARLVYEMLKPLIEASLQFGHDAPDGWAELAAEAHKAGEAA